MKKKLLPHLGWAFIALTTFLIGSKYFGVQNSVSKSESPSKSSISTRASTRTSSDRSAEPKSAASSLADRTSVTGTSTLTGFEILTLGEQFRDAKDPVSRRLAFSELLKNLTPENARLMREQIAHLPQDSPEFREFHYAWGGIAGKEAITNGADTPKLDMAAALAGWANSDPDSALTYFNTLSPKAQSNGSLLKWGTVYGLADSHPELALQFATARSENGDKDAGKMANLVVDALIRHQDQEALANLTRDLPKGEVLNSIGVKVAKNLADTDPAKAYEWTSSLPDGKAKHHALGATFAKWAGKDPEEAARQISRLPEDQANSATYGFASRVAHDDPATGVEWAATITVEKTRNNALLDTGRTYFRKDPAAAAQWLNNSGLPAEMQQKIIKGEKNSGK
jgi:hypothetical protein